MADDAGGGGGGGGGGGMSGGGMGDQGGAYVRNPFTGKWEQNTGQWWIGYTPPPPTPEPTPAPWQPPQTGDQGQEEDYYTLMAPAYEPPPPPKPSFTIGSGYGRPDVNRASQYQGQSDFYQDNYGPTPFWEEIGNWWEKGNTPNAIRDTIGEFWAPKPAQGQEGDFGYPPGEGWGGINSDFRDWMDGFGNFVLPGTGAGGGAGPYPGQQGASIQGAPNVLDTLGALVGGDDDDEGWFANLMSNLSGGANVPVGTPYVEPYDTAYDVPAAPEKGLIPELLHSLFPFYAGTGLNFDYGGYGLGNQTPKEGILGYIQGLFSPKPGAGVTQGGIPGIIQSLGDFVLPGTENIPDPYNIKGQQAGAPSTTLEPGQTVMDAFGLNDEPVINPDGSTATNPDGSVKTYEDLKRESIALGTDVTSPGMNTWAIEELRKQIEEYKLAMAEDKYQTSGYTGPSYGGGGGGGGYYGYPSFGDYDPADPRFWLDMVRWII